MVVKVRNKIFHRKYQSRKKQQSEQTKSYNSLEYEVIFVFIWLIRFRSITWKNLLHNQTDGVLLTDCSKYKNITASVTTKDLAIPLLPCIWHVYEDEHGVLSLFAVGNIKYYFPQKMTSRLLEQMINVGESRSKWKMIRHSSSDSHYNILHSCSTGIALLVNAFSILLYKLYLWGNKHSVCSFFFFIITSAF